MKRVIVLLSMMILLLVGSVSVFADPHAVPDTETVVSTVNLVEVK